MDFQALQQEQAYLSNREASSRRRVFAASAEVIGRDARTGLLQIDYEGRRYQLHDFSWTGTPIGSIPKSAVLINGSPGFVNG